MNIIILAIIAGLILHRLYTILGKDNGYKPKSQKSRVVNISTNIKQEAVQKKRNNLQDWSSETHEVIKKIIKKDLNFNYEDFIDGSNRAFEVILSAYEQNKVNVLKSLLSDKIFKAFKLSMQERKLKKERICNTLVKINSIDVLQVRMNAKGIVQIKVKYKFEQIFAVYNENNELIEGNSQDINNAEDIWTFERNLNSDNVNWVLVSTE